MRLYTQAQINDLKKDIASWWRNTSDSALQTGRCLVNLRAGVPADVFSDYVDNELSRLGISRSTAYRWMVLYQELTSLFPNRHIREALLPLNGGRGIFADGSDFDFGTELWEDDWGNRGERVKSLPARLTPAAQEALSRLPKPPEEHRGASDAAAWAASFVKAVKEARARRSAEARAARKTEAGQAKQRQEFLGKLHGLAARCSPEALREFREQLIQVLDEHDASPEQVPGNPTVASVVRVPQSQVGTGNPAPAAQAKTANPGVAPDALNHPNKDGQQTGVSPASVSPSGVAVAKLSQSQVGTGNPSPTAQAKASASGAAPNTVNHPNKEGMQGIPSTPASSSAEPAANHPQSQVETGNRRRRQEGRRPPAWITKLLDSSDQGRVQNGISPAPVSQNARPAAKHSQSQVGTGNLSPAA
jgi:hypothetical protein